MSYTVTNETSIKQLNEFSNLYNIAITPMNKPKHIMTNQQGYALNKMIKRI